MGARSGKQDHEKKKDSAASAAVGASNWPSELLETKPQGTETGISPGLADRGADGDRLQGHFAIF